MVEHGADVNARTTRGLTLLHVAVEEKKNDEVVRVLLEHGANVDAEDDEGRTPFQIASARRGDKTMKLLLEHGAKGVLSTSYSLSTSSLCLP